MPRSRTETTTRIPVRAIALLFGGTLLTLGLILSTRGNSRLSPRTAPASRPATRGAGVAVGARPTPFGETGAVVDGGERGSDLMSAATFVNAGYATPDAAVVTFIWALSHGNVDVAARALALDAHGQSTIEAFLARLPADVAARYRPPERFIALLWAAEWADAGELAGVKVLDARQSDATASVRLECRFASGRKFRFRLNLAPSAAGWQTQVESSLVDGFISNHFLEPQTVSLR